VYCFQINLAIGETFQKSAAAVYKGFNHERHRLGNHLFYTAQKITDSNGAEAFSSRYRRAPKLLRQS